MSSRHQTPAAKTAIGIEARRDEIVELLREMTDLGMRMARKAAAAALDPESEADETPAPTASRAFRPLSSSRTASRPADPHLVYARVTRAVREAISLELRILGGAFIRSGRYAARFVPPDAGLNARRAKIRPALHGAAAKAEPNRAALTQLCHHADECLDDELRNNPNAELIDTLEAVAQQLGLTLDYKNLSDELLGMDPVTLPEHPPERPIERLTEHPDKPPDGNAH